MYCYVQVLGFDNFSSKPKACEGFDHTGETSLSFDNFSSTMRTGIFLSCKEDGGNRNQERQGIIRVFFRNIKFVA